MKPRPAELVLCGPPGISLTPCTVLHETPKRYLILNHSESWIRLGGRNRWLAPGAKAFVPRREIQFLDEVSE